MAEDSLKYLKWLKKQPEEQGRGCLVCGNLVVDLDHLEAIGMGGNRKKPTLKHYTCILLCRLHHTERHAIGITEFEAKYKINVWKEAFKLRENYIQILLRDYYSD